MNFLNRIASSFEELVLLIKQLVEMNNKVLKCADCQKEMVSKDTEHHNIREDIQDMIPRKEVISILNIDPSTYTRWKQRGVIRSVSIGGRDYVRKEDMKAAIKESRRKGKI